MHNKVGKEWCRQELGTKSFCVAQTNHLTHDLKLTEAYYNLPKSIITFNILYIKAAHITTTRKSIIIFLNVKFNHFCFIFILSKYVL